MTIVDILRVKDQKLIFIFDQVVFRLDVVYLSGSNKALFRGCYQYHNTYFGRLQNYSWIHYKFYDR